MTLSSLKELANQILKTNLEKLKANAAVARKTLNPEAIHNMRVATRKLQAALKAFKKILPPKAKKIRTELKKLFRILGKKRDLDIFSKFLFESAQVDYLSFPKLKRKMDKSQKRILSKLKSKYYKRLTHALKGMKPLSIKKNILRISRNRIRKALARVLVIAPLVDSTVDDITLHKLRISIKKLRYVCEFFAPLFAKNIYPLDPLIEKTIKIQDILGEYQDALTGISTLIRFKNQFSQEQFLKIKKNYERKKVKARKSFFKIWK